MRRHIYYTLQSLLHKQGSNAIKIVSLALGLLMSVFLFARIAFELYCEDGLVEKWSVGRGRKFLHYYSGS